MRHIIASLLFLIATTVFADPAPFGLEIGKASVADAEKMYSIEKTGNAEYHEGVVYKAAVNQVAFDGLKELTFVFNKKNVLEAVIATLPNSQFESLHESLSKKYKAIGEKNPYVGDKQMDYVNGSTRISLTAKHLSFDTKVIYMHKDLLSSLREQEKTEAAAKKKSQEDKL